MWSVACDRRSTDLCFHNSISHFLGEKLRCFVFSDMMRQVNTKPMKMRAWQTRAQVLGHVELVDCEDQTWSDTTDGKWHPNLEEPEEMAKDNISYIS